MRIFNFIKRLFYRKRKLKGKWSLEPIEDLRSEHSLHAEEILTKLAIDEINKNK